MIFMQNRLAFLVRPSLRDNRYALCSAVDAIVADVFPRIVKPP